MQWVEGRVRSLKQWAKGLYSIYIDADVPVFTAGQFTQIGLDIDGKRIGRPYSFVSAPEERPLEFIFVVVPDGLLTLALEKLKPGDPISVLARPAGLFTLKEVPEGKHLWLLATGTALGVFLSILKTETPWSRFEKITLVHGVRQVSNLTHQDIIRVWQEKYPERFRYIPFASRDKAEGVLEGRIPKAIQSGLLEDKAGLKFSPEESQIMICGNPAMIVDTQAALLEKGLKKNLRRDPGHITIENYWKE